VEKIQKNNELDKLLISRSHIPENWRWLMTDAKSPIIDLYPKDFEIDLKGTKFAWQGVALLPFVDEKRLLSALDTVIAGEMKQLHQRILPQSGL
jgi:5'-3' exonuclease